MPSEFRQIVFRNNELTAALHAYRESMAEVPPAGQIIACGIETSGRVAIKLVYLDDATGKARDVHLSPAVAAAAMLSYCAALDIPVPLRSSKSIQMFGDNLGLAIRIGSTTVSFSETIEIANPLPTRAAPH